VLCSICRRFLLTSSCAINSTRKCPLLASRGHFRCRGRVGSGGAPANWCSCGAARCGLACSSGAVARVPRAGGRHGASGQSDGPCPPERLRWPCSTALSLRGVMTACAGTGPLGRVRNAAARLPPPRPGCFWGASPLLTQNQSLHKQRSCPLRLCICAGHLACRDPQSVLDSPHDEIIQAWDSWRDGPSTR